MIFILAQQNTRLKLSDTNHSFLSWIRRTPVQRLGSMHCIVFTFVIAVLFQVQAVAQNGHYITWEGDTVLVDINIPKTFPAEENFEKLFKEVM